MVFKALLRKLRLSPEAQHRQGYGVMLTCDACGHENGLLPLKMSSRNFLAQTHFKIKCKFCGKRQLRGTLVLID